MSQEPTSQEPSDRIETKPLQVVAAGFSGPRGYQLSLAQISQGRRRTLPDSTSAPSVRPWLAFVWRRAIAVV
jgi:hypothetical protein